MPTQATQEQQLVGDVTVYFDGACAAGVLKGSGDDDKRRLGSGGFVVIDKSNKILGGGVKFYGDKHNTNNKVEVAIMVDALRYV